MLIRRANINDKDLIKKIHQESSKEIGSFNLFYVWDLYLCGTSKYSFYIFEDCSFVRYGYSEKYKSNIIYEIGVLKSCRGLGVARRMIEQLDKPLMLKCNTDNIVGNLFYEKIGMRKVGVVKSSNSKKSMNVWVA